MNTLIRLADRRARLFGLDAPQKRVIEVVTEEMMEEMVQDMEARAAALEAEYPPDTVDAEVVEDH